MTRGKRLAQRVLEAAALLFLVLLAGLYRRPGTRAGQRESEPVAGTLAAEAKGVREQVRFQGFDYLETREREGRYRLRATEALGFEENGQQMFRLKDVLFESEESAPGRRVALAAPRAEFARLSRAIRVFDGVRIEGEETTLRGASFRYDPARRTFRSDGPVVAVRGAMVANAERGALRSEDGAVELEGNVRLRGRADGRALDLAAPRTRLTREGEISAEGGVVAKSDDSLLRCDRLLRVAEGEGDRIQATGGARLLLSPRPPRAREPLLAEGDAIELQRAADGTPRFLQLTREGGSARILAPPGPEQGARKALSSRFVGVFTDEGVLSELQVPGAGEGYETGETGLRQIRSGTARLTFLADGGLDVAALGGGVHLVDGGKSELTASEGTLRGVDRAAVFTGGVGAPAVYRDERGTVRAKTISYLEREDRVDAVGDVLVDYRSGEPAAGHTSFFGGRGSEPFRSRSESLELRLGARKLTLRGKVQAWQTENVLRCRTLVLDDAERSLRAEGEVRAFLRRRPGTSPAPAKGQSHAAETINASGDLMTHRESDRLVRIEGHATIVSGSWVMNSDVTDIRIGPEQQVEYAEARGTVVLEDQALHRRGEGTRATWRPSVDAVSLEGTPAVVVDEKGNRLTGGKLTMRQGRSRVDVEPGTGVPTEGVFRPEAP